jgi:hypothetical protein
MEIKDNELYVFFEGQGFEYMQNTYGTEESKKYRIYDNNEYIMLRKIVSNEYFLSMQEHNQRYHTSQKYPFIHSESISLWSTRTPSLASSPRRFSIRPSIAKSLSGSAVSVRFSRRCRSSRDCQALSSISSVNS